MHQCGMLDELSINVFVNMHKNYSYPTTMYESILIQMHVFLVLFSLQCVVFTMKIFKAKIDKNIFFFQTFVHLGGNTYMYL